MSVYNEREILSVFLTRPALIEYGLDDLFRDPVCRAAYHSMMVLLQAGQPITPPAVAENMPGDAVSNLARIGELLGFTEYMKPINLERELSDCVYKLRADYYRQRIASQCGDPLYNLEDIRADLSKIKYLREVHAGNTVTDGIVSLKDSLACTDNVRCGFSFIDEKTAGFRRGELVAVMARPAVGKTFVLLNMIHYLRLADLRLGLFSLEMPLSGITERLMQIHDGVERPSVTEDYLNLNDHSAFRDTYKKLTIHSRIYSVAEISRLVEQDRNDVVFVDFLGLIKPGREYKSSYERVSAAFIELKSMAKEKNVVVFIAVQLSRQGGDAMAPVKMESARDSGQVEELSDFIVGCWRPYLFDSSGEITTDPMKWAALRMSLEKNKRGETATRTFRLRPTGRIIEMTADDMACFRKQKKESHTEMVNE